MAVPQVIPQWQIIQEFSASPTAAEQPFNALIVGPAYGVQTGVAAGTYSGSQTTYAWPNLSAGDVVDQAYTKVEIANAAQRFGLINVGSAVQTVVGTANQIKSTSSSVNWKQNGSFARNGGISFDPVIGDWVRVFNGSQYYTTAITGFTGTTDPATPIPGLSSPGTVAGATSNVATQSAVSTVVASIPGGSLITETPSASAYVGHATRNLNEVYTISVVQGGTPANVILSVTSLSGTDPQQTITGVTLGVAVNIGSRGATMTFSGNSTSSAFVTGDHWTWTINEAYTTPTVTPAGTYTGTANTTYIVTVVRGGDWTSGTTALKPMISVTTADASDVGLPLVVGTGAVAIGTKGINFTFSAGDNLLVAGDQWTIAATAQAVGAVTNLILANTLPLAFQGVNLQVEIAVLGDLVDLSNKSATPGTYNWTQSATALTLNSAITSTVSRGGSTALPVVSGNVIITLRALRSALANQVYDVVTAADASALLGPDVVDSTLAYGVYRAIAGAAGMTVKVLPVATNDLAGFSAALAVLKNRIDFYRAVPLTYDETIQLAVQSFVDSRSTPSQAAWATAMFSKALLTSRELVGAAVQGGTPSMATITDALGGTNYTHVLDLSGTFIISGVQAGDIVRAKYVSDGFGGTTYSTFVVNNVVSNEELYLVSGPAAPTSVAALYEIWHPLTLNEQAASIGTRAASHNDRRITVSFPSNPGRGGVRVPGYFLSCYLAAQRGAAAPQQGLSTAAVTDWDDMGEAALTFANQLDNLANYGMYIVTQSPTGQCYIRKAITTDLSDTRKAEDMATVNFDSCSYYLQQILAPFAGKANNVSSAYTVMESAINTGIQFLVTGTNTNKLLGGQMVSGSLSSMRPSATQLDAAVITLNAVLPIPLNNGTMTFII